MEVINNKRAEQTNATFGTNTENNNGNSEKQKITSHSMVFVGVMLIILGVIWMLSNLDIINSSLFDLIFSWQMLLIVLGAYLIVVQRYWSGGASAIVGTLFLLTDYFDINIPVVEIFLPAVVIALGVGVILARNK